MDRNFESAHELRVAPEPVMWKRPGLVEEGETAVSRASAPDLRSGLDRWNLATGIEVTPTFHQLLDRWRPVHAPEIPTTLLVAFSKYEASGWNDATHGTAGNGYTSPPFYELGVFQVPAGLHGHCTVRQCEHDPPGPENPASPSAWSRICRRLRLEPNKWKDPITQVRVGLSNLEDDAQIIRKRYPELFPRPGTDWDLRGAVLLPFVGIGTANGLIKTYRQKLAQIPEADRWRFLNSQAIDQQTDARRAAHMRDLLNNVEKKMKLHEALVAHFASNPSTSAAPPKSASATAAPVLPSVPQSPRTSGGWVAPPGGLQGSLPSPAEPDVAAYAAKLGGTWSSRRKGKPSAEAIRDWLLKDHQYTLDGATSRFGNRYTRAAISRAWMVSREEQMKFKTVSSAQIRPLRHFNPPSEPVTRVSSLLIKGSDKEKVAPVVVRFVAELRRRHSTFRADTYRGHGGGSFEGKGYSIDLWLPSDLDDRGFFKRDASVKLLRAVGAAAGAVNLDWRILYNDFSVANVVNREAGIERVVFVGKPVTRGIIWHGPHPLILHFHLDLGVQRKA
jgi:hypothetical protein